MKSFIQKHKTQIIAVITAISAAALALTPLGGNTTKVCEIVVAVDAILIAFLKTGLDATLVNNSVALLKLLQDIYNITPISAAPMIAGLQGGEDMCDKNTPMEEVKVEDVTVTEIPIEESPGKETPKDKLTDDQLKDLVISYMNK
jgi:hypothetical protein